MIIQIEEAFMRFPHIGEQILEKLDDKSLFKCQKVSRPWQEFIAENTKIQKVLAIEVLQKNTLIPKTSLKKSMHKHDLKTVQKYLGIVHKITFPKILQLKY